MRFFAPGAYLLDAVAWGSPSAAGLLLSFTGRVLHEFCQSYYGLTILVILLNVLKVTAIHKNGPKQYKKPEGEIKPLI